MRVSRSDRRASRRVVLAAALLRIGDNIVWIAFLTGVPAPLVELLQDELREKSIESEPAGSRTGRLVDTGSHLFALACVGACVVALAERAIALSATTAALTVITVTYRRRRARAASRFPPLPWDQPADPRGVGRD